MLPPALLLCQMSRYITAKQFIIQNAWIYKGISADGGKLCVMTYAQTWRTARESLKIWIFFVMQWLFVSWCNWHTSMEPLRNTPSEELGT